MNRLLMTGLTVGLIAASGSVFGQQQWTQSLTLKSTAVYNPDQFDIAIGYSAKSASPPYNLQYYVRNLTLHQSDNDVPQNITGTLSYPGRVYSMYVITFTWRGSSCTINQQDINQTTLCQLEPVIMGPHVPWSIYFYSDGQGNYYAAPATII